MTKKAGKRIFDFFIKLLLFLLVASFTLWGIGDIFRGRQGSNHLATVGDSVISIADFEQELSLRMANFRQMLGEQFTPEFAKKIGIPQQILREMIDRKLVEQEANTLNIRIPQSEILRTIRNNPSFSSGKGFDKDLFQNALRNARISEELYVESLRQENASRLLLSSFEAESLLREETAEALYRARHETRDATLYVFSPRSLAAIGEPDDETLQTYFQKNAAKYQTPEYRQLAYLHFRHDELKENLRVDDETLHTLYEERKMAFHEPERRRISQLLYAGKEEAIHALELLQNGETVETVAKKIPTINQETDLGLVTRSDLLKEAQESVFNLAIKDYSNPIESSFGWHVFQVREVVPERVPDFNELKDRLTQEWAEIALEEKIYNLSVELEDMISGGMKLQEIATEQGTKLQKIPAIDAQGMTTAGKPVSLPPVDDLLAKAFSPDFESVFTNGSDNDYYFFALENVTPSQLPELSSVKEKVTADWKQYEQQNQLRMKTGEIAAALKEGKKEALQDLAYTTRHSGPLMREEEKGETGPADAPYKYELFTLPEGSYTGAYPLKDGTTVIAKLTAVHAAPPPKEAELRALINSLKEQYAQEIQQQYLAFLQDKYAVEVNRQALDAALQ